MLPPARWLDALRWSPPTLHAKATRDRWRRRRQAGARSDGDCPLCGAGTSFVGHAANVRESPLCARCGSVPRTRALVSVLRTLVPDLACAAVHEASPSLASWRFLRPRCARFVASMWLPGARDGARVGAFRNADLGRQPFADASFDLVITQDVLEHLPDPDAALREIARTLRAGGRHVFTVPRRRDRPTRARVEWRGGTLHHLLPAEHHDDPSSRAGSLVVTDWGMDLEAVVADRARTRCWRVDVLRPELGIAQPIEVFVAGPHSP